MKVIQVCLEPEIIELLEDLKDRENRQSLSETARHAIILGVKDNNSEPSLRKGGFRKYFSR